MILSEEPFMIDLLKKTAFVGIGMVAITKDKLEEISKEFIAKGQFSEQEGEKFVEELLQRSEETRRELEKQIDVAITTVVQKMKLVRLEDLESLKSEIHSLRIELGELQKNDAETANEDANV